MKVKPIKRINIPDSTRINFVDKRTTIKETLSDGTINFYDLDSSLLCEGYFTNQIRGELQRVETEKVVYYTYTFNNGDKTHYRNFYTLRARL
jgi:hypothetical protein|nr:MAG TPA_asm: hypothetical protein [Caudoviricetes sp.]